MVSKNNSKRNIDVDFRIIDRWRFNFEFIVYNIWLIMFALLLFFFNVLHSHREILNIEIDGLLATAKSFVSDVIEELTTSAKDAVVKP
ncbi:hypothetical protein [Borrelia crocidurae]|nr:hypothetical protein [Borrelia crocidurae]